MAAFVPARVLIEPSALDWPIGRELADHFRAAGVPTTVLPAHNRLPREAGLTPSAAYGRAKQTLVIAVRRTLRFQTCKPSAHYQLPLVSSCPGLCEYCYLQTTLGAHPVIRFYVNTDEILAEAGRLIAAREPALTVFEGAATSDPLPIERYTGSLAATIRFFADQQHGRFRFVTKFADVDSLLELRHNGHTTWRFSLNSDRVIRAYEHGTASLAERIAAAERVATAGYPLGFLIAPILLEGDWRTEYADLLAALAARLPQAATADELTFELITHRFTSRAKANIAAVFPASTLPLTEADRQFKMGQFGYGKYVYQAHARADAATFFAQAIADRFPRATVSYLV